MLLTPVLLACQRSDSADPQPSAIEDLFSGSSQSEKIQAERKARQEAQRRQAEALQQERLRSYNQ